jgi:small-conductance mechanosensitive channel
MLINYPKNTLEYNKEYHDKLLEEEEKLNKLSKEILQMKEKQDLIVNDYYDQHENQVKNEIQLLKQTVDEDKTRLDIKKKLDDASKDRRIIQVEELEKQLCRLVDRSEKMRELEIRKIDEE